MSKAQIENLEREVRALRKQMEFMREPPGDIPFTPCDSSCIVTSGHSSKGGQHTNGGCRCEERTLRRAVQWWRRRAEFLQITIQDFMKDVGDEQRDERKGLTFTRD